MSYKGFIYADTPEEFVITADASQMEISRKPPSFGFSVFKHLVVPTVIVTPLVFFVYKAVMEKGGHKFDFTKLLDASYFPGANIHDYLFYGVILAPFVTGLISMIGSMYEALKNPKIQISRDIIKLNRSLPAAAETEISRGAFNEVQLRKHLIGKWPATSIALQMPPDKWLYLVSVDGYRNPIPQNLMEIAEFITKHHSVPLREFESNGKPKELQP